MPPLRVDGTKPIGGVRGGYEAHFGGRGEIGAIDIDGRSGVSEFLFGGSRGDFGGGQAGLLEVLELGEGCVVGFFEEGDAAVQAHEDGAGIVEAFAEGGAVAAGSVGGVEFRSEEHTSELQS